MLLHTCRRSLRNGCGRKKSNEVNKREETSANKGPGCKLHCKIPSSVAKCGERNTLEELLSSNSYISVPWCVNAKELLGKPASAAAAEVLLHFYCVLKVRCYRADGMFGSCRLYQCGITVDVTCMDVKQVIAERMICAPWMNNYLTANSVSRLSAMKADNRLLETEEICQTEKWVKIHSTAIRLDMEPDDIQI